MRTDSIDRSLGRVSLATRVGRRGASATNSLPLFDECLYLQSRAEMGSRRVFCVVYQLDDVNVAIRCVHRGLRDLMH